MTEPQQQAAIVPPEGASERELIAALVAALIAGAAVAVIAKILSRFAGVGSVAIRIIEELGWESLIRVTADEIALLPRDNTPSVRILHESAVHNAIRRATYMINASRRLAPAFTARDPQRRAQAIAVEERHRAAHQEAERKRSEAARLVAEEAFEHGVDARGELLLGWRAVLDNRTSVDCRWANGRNFNALIRPRIGYPGQVHLACRCRAVRPFRTDKRVEHGTIPTHD